MRKTYILFWFLVVTSRAAATPPVMIPLPGRPFGVACSNDGNSVFVSLSPTRNSKIGLAVLQNDNGQFKLKRSIPLTGLPSGVALTHDGKDLIVAAVSSVLILDTSRLISGSGDPVVATFSDGDAAASVYVNVTADDKLLFVSDENAKTITVIDLNRVRSTGYDQKAVIGKIPVGLAPIALTFSPDGRWLYTTSEAAPPEWDWPKKYKPETSDPAQPQEMDPAGAVVVVDVAKAGTDPAHSVVARVPAGASPVRMTISADGRRIYVTARASNAVLVFDTGKLLSDPDHSLLATATVGNSPVPLALIQGGKTLVVGNSNRFGADSDKAQTLSVLDASQITQSPAVIGTIEAGAFPREMCVSPDGKTLFVTNFGSSSLEIIDAQNPPVEHK